jgi:osmotically-inducible protein OsmY
VDSEEVSVTVDDGVVTLTGTVDTWSERQSAEENAYEGGAKDVMNDLRVNYRGYGPYDYNDGYYPYQP